MSHKNLLFIIRSFNDLDHRTPLLFYLLDKNYYKIEIIFIGPIRILINNYNLKYLLKSKNFKFYFMTKFGLKINIKVFPKVNIISRIFDRFFFDELSILKIKKNFFKNFDSIICDWIYPPHPIFNFFSLLKKKTNIKIFALPHGINIFTNMDYVNHSHLEERDNQIKECISKNIFFDGVIVQNEHMVKIKNHQKIPKNLIHVTGCVRFGKYWNEHLPYVYIDELKILDNFIKKNKFDTRFKNIVTIFLHKPIYNENLVAISEMINDFKNLKNTIFFIKGHTRGEDYEFFYKGVSFNGDNIINMSKFSSYSLIKFSDYCIVYSSSIAVESIKQNINTIIPTFLDSNGNLMREILKKNLVNSTQEIIQILNREINLNDKKEVDSFLNFITGSDYGDPFKNIINLIH